MGLKYLLVRQNQAILSARPRSRLLAFLIYDQEEFRVRSILREHGSRCKILLSGNFTDDTAERQNFLNRWLGEIDALAITGRTLDSFQLASVLTQAHIQGVNVMDLETALLEIDPSVPASSDQLIRLLAMKAVHQNGQVKAYTKAKAIVEPLIAGLLLLIMSPIILLVCLAIKLTSRGPVMYSQTRVGLGGKPFEIYKFRSMRTDAEKNGAVWASAKKADTRLTPIGGFLRASHLDEIPQLWNVVKGELSFIGPRPERPIFVEQLQKEIPLFGLRTMVKPGITGWAQIRQGYANSIADSQRKLEFDLFYIMKHSLWLDVLTVLGTLVVLFTGGTEGRKRERENVVGKAKHGVSPKVVGKR